MISLDNSHCYLDKDAFPSLLEFNINVGGYFFSDSKKIIRFQHSYVESGWMGLLEIAELVELEEVSGLPNGFSDSDMRVAFANLRELKIYSCQDMEHVANWNGRNQRLACFTNLTMVHIHSCTRLKFVFSSSVAKCLLQMQTLQVYFCDEIEEIVRIDESAEHGEEIICFPKLRELHLYSLPSLTSFYSYQVAYPLLEIKDRDKSLSFGQLEVLNVAKCNVLENVIPVTMLHRFEYLTVLCIGQCRSLKTVFQHFPLANLKEINNEHIVFPAVKELVMDFLPQLKSFWSCDNDYAEVNPNQCQPYIPKVTFPNVVKFHIRNVSLGEEIELGGYDHSSSKLTSLEVYKYWDIDFFRGLGTFGDLGFEINNQVLLLPSQWKLQLQNLETLLLQNCCWPGHSLFTGPLTFKRLSAIEVHSWGGSTLFTTSVFKSFQQLEKLTVSGCPLLEKIVEEDANGTNENTLISLFQLKSVSLHDLPNLQSIGISACYMPALCEVEVDRCGLISTLFTHSAFKNLQLLQELEVSGCPLLEEIVEDEMDDKTQGTSEKMVSLLLLSKIVLRSLPRLRAFGSSSTFTFNLPALGTIYLYECPCMDKFTSLLITAPLVKIFNEFNHIKHVSDLNNYLRIEEDNDTSDKACDGESSHNDNEVREILTKMHWRIEAARARGH